MGSIEPIEPTLTTPLYVQGGFLVECAHFDPEIILGKSVKHGITSDAAHKFERYTDPNCHDYVLRRFLKIIEEEGKTKYIMTQKGFFKRR